MSPLGRRYGWAADRVRRVRLVTPDGEVRDVTAASDPELFWAVRGGGSGFGIATELEFDLVPGDATYGGGLFLPGECAPELVAAFGRVTERAPDALSLSVAFVSFPPIDAVPAPLRGRFVAHLRVTYTGALEEAERSIAPLRAVAAPIVDTVRPLPILEFGTIHGDPTTPQRCGGAVLPGWDDAAVEVLLDEVGPATPHMLELRHLGGALARPPAAPSAVGHRDAAFTVFTSAYPGPAFVDAAGVQTAFYERLLPWSGGRSLLNFTSRSDGAPVDARGAFDAETLARLQEVKAATDSGNLFQTGVTIPTPATVS